MAFTLIASTADGDDALTVTTDAIVTTGADLIVVNLGYFGGTVELRDSKSNTWIPLSVAPTTSGYEQRLYYCVSPVVGSGHTFTADDGGGAVAARYIGIAVLAFSGVNTSDAKDQESAGATNGSATSIQPGSVTPDEDNCLVVAGLGWNSGTPSINGGYAEIHADAVGGNTVGSAIAYLIQTSAGATNPTWSWSSSVPAMASSVVFHAAVSSDPPPPNSMFRSLPFLMRIRV